MNARLRDRVSRSVILKLMMNIFNLTAKVKRTTTQSISESDLL